MTSHEYSCQESQIPYKELRLVRQQLVKEFIVITHVTVELNDFNAFSVGTSTYLEHLPFNFI